MSASKRRSQRGNEKTVLKINTIFDPGNGVDKIGLKKMKSLISIFKLESRYIACRVFKFGVVVIGKVGKLGEIKSNFTEISSFSFTPSKPLVI